MRKKVFFLLFLLGGVYLIIVLARDLWQILGAKDRMVEAEQRVEKLQKEQGELQQELEKTESDEFMEKEARDSLMLAKEGEVVVVIPEVSEVSEVSGEEEEEEELENWEKWWRLFGY